MQLVERPVCRTGLGEFDSRLGRLEVKDESGRSIRGCEERTRQDAPKEVIGPVIVKRPWWLFWVWWIPKERRVLRYKLTNVWMIGPGDEKFIKREDQ